MKFSTGDKVLLLQALWCKERELQQSIKLKEEIGSDPAILEAYKDDLKQVIKLSDEFLNWEF